MDKKILFIGDSWVTNFFNVHSLWGEKSPIRNFWVNEGFKPFFSGSPSRDTQSVLDIWTKHISYLTPDDLLVIFLPVFNRTRLPLKDKRALYVGHGITNFNDYFQGSKSYNPKFNFLEIWGNQYDYKYFNDKLEIQELINGSDASILNYIEVIEALYKLTPCKKIVHCWDYKKHDSSVIIYREEMTELVGEWETRGEVYVRTNGEQEMEGDSHWSDDMNMKFMDFLKKHFEKKYTQTRLI